MNAPLPLPPSKKNFSHNALHLPVCERARADDGASSGRGGFAVIRAVTDRESEEGGGGAGRGMAWNGMMVFALHAVISLRDHRQSLRPSILLARSLAGLDTIINGGSARSSREGPIA